MIHHERLRPPPHDYPADEWHLIEKRYHPEFVGVEVLGACEERDQELVRSLLSQHAAKTGSKVANRLHHGWPVTLRQVVRVAPKS